MTVRVVEAKRERNEAIISSSAAQPHIIVESRDKRHRFFLVYFAYFVRNAFIPRRIVHCVSIECVRMAHNFRLDAITRTSNDGENENKTKTRKSVNRKGEKCKGFSMASLNGLSSTRAFIAWCHDVCAAAQ